MKKFICLILLFICSFPGSRAQRKSDNQKAEIIYHVCQRSFFDSNGDMQGDLNGLRQKLDYLQDLGVTAILLLPLYDADCYHNYFANDFEKIDAEFGTMEEYISLVKDLHKRGMKIYMDMESQYVTEKHAWWKDAVGNLSSPFSDYLLFEDSAHNIPATFVADLRVITSYDGSFIKTTTVNLRNKAVLEYNRKLFTFFMDPNKDGKFDDGVDGFRLDHMMDMLDGKPALSNLFSEFWKPLFLDLKAINPKIKNVGEQSDWRDFGFDYFKKTGVDRMFGFGLQGAILSFDKKQLIQKADTVLGLTPAGKEQLIFLENHDIDRVASTEKNLAKQKLAASLMMFIGGIPAIYYGQEIGMQGKFGSWGISDGNGIPVREAFDWYKSGTGKGMTFWYKDTGPWWTEMNLKPNDGISVEEQLNDPNSLLNHYKKVIQIKQSNQALANGQYLNAENDNSKVFSFYRMQDHQKILVVANLSNDIQRATFNKTHSAYTNLFGESVVKKNTIELKPYEIVVAEVR